MWQYSVCRDDGESYGSGEVPKAREGSTASLAGLTLSLAAPVTYGQWMTLEYRWSGGQRVDGVVVGAQM